jgi:hypothetical protein
MIRLFCFFVCVPLLCGFLLVGGVVGCASSQVRQASQALQAASTLALPRYTVLRTDEAIVIDGKLDERSWQAAMKSGSVAELVNPITGAAPAQRGRAMLLWTDSLLYGAFDCDDAQILASMTTRDDAVYKDDAVEFFIAGETPLRTTAQAHSAPVGEFFGGYIEIELNPRNTILDLFALRAVDAAAQPLSYNTYSLSIRSATALRGTMNDSSDTDSGWSVEFSVPIHELRRMPAAMPREGEIWRANFLRLNYAALGRTPPDRELSAWSPTGIARFHVPERFGELVFSMKRVGER